MPVIGIGASAGGLEALRDMLSVARLPTRCAFVIVQHLDPNHESMLAELLDRASPLDVLQCEGGERLEPDRVYIIPPGRGLALHQGKLQLTDFAQPRGLRRPIDDFFISLAADQQANAACVILSGTGADGSTGLRAIKEHGGVCVAQDPETARYDGMPLAAVGTGLVDYVKPPSEILDCLNAFFTRRNGDPKDVAAQVVADHIDDMCTTLRTTIGHDFAGYKRSTLVRRVDRRMHVLNIDNPGSYLQRIRNDSEECEALFRDLLINVTRFFRDPDMFETLRTKVVEPLLLDRAEGEDVRVWVPGCSSGEEAYSIAMLFAEAARLHGLANPVQIFATDIDEQMLQVAREGSYPAAAFADIPSPMRERYTVPHGERFTITGQIRDLIRFSNHSVVKDPPFSRIDLVSCRNLLIYFDDSLQKSVMPILHYALRPGGYLFLGPSESIGRFEHLFPALDHHAHIFERAPGNPSYPIDLPANDRRDPAPSSNASARARMTSARGPRADVAIQRLAEGYAPPAMVVNQDGAVMSAYGKLSRYFDFPVTRTGGSNAISLAKPGLRDVLGPLVRQARDEGRRVVARKVEVSSDYGVQPIEVIGEPIGDGSLLLIFRDRGPFRPFSDDAAEIESGDDHMEALEEELRLTRHKLRTAVEELETANEELKSSNEEMMSMNEELQSTNEELSTVNDELKSKVDQLTVANSDLRNFFESTELAVIVLDADLNIRSFTEAATGIFPLQQGDRGRSLADVTSRLEDTGYLDDAREVAASGEPVQRHVHTRDGKRTLSLRVLPYRTQHGTTDGATLVLTDITEALSVANDLANERERLDLAIKAGGMGVWQYTLETGELVSDETNRHLLGLGESDGSLTRIEQALERLHPEDRPEVEARLARAKAVGDDFEASFRVVPGDEPVRHLKAFGRMTLKRGQHRLVGAVIDMTAEYTLAETRALMLREMNHRVKNLFAVVSGMISAAGRSHDDVRTYSEDLRERIAALGRAHSLAAPTGDQQSISLAELVETTIAPYRDQGTITLEGPEIEIERNCLSSLALILHEWTTNAAKYGALRDGSGTLTISWTRNAEGLALDWSESGGDLSDIKQGTGFGTLLVTTSVRQLKAELTRSTEDGRYRLELQLPGAVIAA
ncbi:PAS domain-containing protein [Novosphingobium sp. YJ-S2-02]|uniref:PAS domain-containing protein n=2 Tax=Novosphingobium aureum TaxID=2792964 RepID=A0A931ML18_9SPHN|nr:PAS domain-containing protein [Novosphingobium aureum]